MLSVFSEDLPETCLSLLAMFMSIFSDLLTCREEYLHADDLRFDVVLIHPFVPHVWRFSEKFRPAAFTFLYSEIETEVSFRIRASV